MAFLPLNITKAPASMYRAFGDQHHIGLNKTMLFTDSVSLVVNPRILPDQFEIMDEDTKIHALIQLPMIHVEWGDDNDYLPNWEDWLQSTGMSTKPPSKGPHFNLSSMAIEAAVQGKGLLLGQQLLIENELRSGQLIKPSRINLPLERAYYLIYPKRTLDSPGAIAFIHWLKKVFENYTAIFYGLLITMAFS